MHACELYFATGNSYLSNPCGRIWRPQGTQPTGNTAHREHSPQGQPTGNTAHREHSPQGTQPTGNTAHRDSPQGNTAHREHSPEGAQPRGSLNFEPYKPLVISNTKQLLVQNIVSYGSFDLHTFIVLQRGIPITGQGEVFSFYWSGTLTHYSIL